MLGKKRRQGLLVAAFQALAKFVGLNTFVVHRGSIALGTKTDPSILHEKSLHRQSFGGVTRYSQFSLQPANRRHNGGWSTEVPGMVRCTNQPRKTVNVIKDSTPCATHHLRGSSLHTPYNRRHPKSAKKLQPACRKSPGLFVTSPLGRRMGITLAALLTALFVSRRR